MTMKTAISEAEMAGKVNDSYNENMQHHQPAAYEKPMSINVMALSISNIIMGMAWRQWR
jgi:hypothetical protein